MIRLGHGALKTVFLEVGNDRVIEITAAYNGLYTRIDLDQFPNGLFAPHSAFDGEIQNDGIEWLPNLFVFCTLQWLHPRLLRSPLRTLTAPTSFETGLSAFPRRP